MKVHRNSQAPAGVLGVLLIASLSASAQSGSAKASFQPSNAPSQAKELYLSALDYAKGSGVPRDQHQAAEYMRQSAELGYAIAQNDLGVYYAKGFGVAQDYAEAAKWYRKAAENGDPLGQYSLGRCYFEGRGLPTNVVESIKWYKMAAAQNQPDALLALGYIYFNGQPGIPADWLEARRWFQRAVDQGRIGGLNPIGFMYEYGGQGIEQNINKAVQTYREAADRGDVDGQMNLGRVYMEGSGIKPDFEEAYKWLYVARANGSGIANHYLQELEGSDLNQGALLTPEQIGKAIQAAHQILREKVKTKARTK